MRAAIRREARKMAAPAVLAAAVVAQAVALLGRAALATLLALHRLKAQMVEAALTLPVSERLVAGVALPLLAVTAQAQLLGMAAMEQRLLSRVHP